MAAVFTPSTSEKDTSLMLICGNLSPLTNDLIQTVVNDFRLIILRNPKHFPKQDNLFQVYDTAVGTISDLKDRVEYAVFFLNTIEDKRLLEKLVPKLERDKPRTVVVFQLKNWEDFSDVVLALKHIPSITFTVLGEMFGNDIPSDTSRASHIVYTALTQKKATFTGNDLVSVFPISATDALKGVQYLLFAKEKSRMVFLYYEHPQTIISAIHLIKRVESDLQILYDRKIPDFPEYPTHKQIENQISAKTHFTPVYINDILDGFENCVSNIKYSDNIAIHPASKSKRVVKKIAKKKSQAKSFFTIFTVSVLLYLIINTLLTITGVILAKQSLQSLQEGNFSKASSQLTLANRCFQITQPVIDLGFSTADALQIPLSDSYKTFTSGIRISNLAAAELEKVNKINKGLSQEELLETLANINYLYFTAQSSKSISRLPYMDKLSTIPAGDFLSLGSILPDVLGYRSPKTYLFLFQNNGELRPTGGFIGSVGELTVSKGLAKSFVIHDVYDVDGQLKTHSEPPFIVRRFLQPHLYLRDSNFSPDFQETATTAAALYHQSVGKTVDGVIATDYDVLRSIISATGPLYIPSLDRTIDEQNGFEFIQSTIEESFFPGSSQKKDLLKEIWGQLSLKLQNPKNALAVAMLLPSLIEEKHILFSIKEPLLQEAFSVQGYGGTILSSTENQENTLNDYFALNEANIGVNKANIHIDRTVNITQVLDTDKLTSNVVVNLENTGEEEYKVYLRVIVPSESAFESLQIDGKEEETVNGITNPQQYEATSFRVPQQTERFEEVFKDKKMIGFIFTVPRKTKKSYTIKYSRDIKLPLKEFSYNFIYQTQPGTNGYPLTTRVIYDSQLIAQEVTPGSINNGQAVTQIPSIKKDQKTSIKFHHR